MTENGYTVSDMTDELRTDWRIGSLIEDSRSLHTEDMRIDFCVMDSTDSARRIYSGMTLPVKDGKEYTYKSTNYSIFSIEDDNLYTAKIYSGNTVIYAAASHEYRGELVDLLRQMGYYKKKEKHPHELTRGCFLNFCYQSSTVTVPSSSTVMVMPSLT